MKDEIRDLKAKMAIDCTIHLKPAILYRGKVFNREIDLLVTGIGSDRMEKGLVEALQLCHPKSILLTGYAGGTTPVVSVGSLVVARDVIDEKRERRFSCDKKLFEKAKKICEGEKWHYQEGDLLTVDRIVNSPYEKADLGATYSVLALEMEASALAKVASKRNIPFLVVRAILDPVEEWIPSLEGCCEETGEPKLMKLTKQILKNPKEMMKLPKLYYWATQARGAVTRFLEGWISHPN